MYKKIEKGRKINMINTTRQSSGITLIALVITIIVLLILAGVTIASLTGDNGLLNRASDARESTQRAQVIERAKLAVLENEVKPEAEKQTLAEVLGAYFDVSGKDLSNMSTELTTTDGKYIVTVGEILQGTASGGGGSGGSGGADSTDYSDDVKTALKIENNVSKYVTYNGITCRVLYDASSPYGIEIIAANPVAKVTLGQTDPAGNDVTGSGNSGTYDRAKWSYNNAIATLNKAADGYVVANDGIVEYARCVGSVPGSYEARETKISTEANQYPYLTGKGLEQGEEVYKDDTAVEGYTPNYTSDKNQLDALGIAGISDTTNGSYYWLASRSVGAYSDSTYFGVRIVNSNGNLNDYSLCGVNSYGDTYTNGNSFGLRPVFHLASGVKIANDGKGGTSEDDAYNLTK